MDKPAAGSAVTGGPIRHNGHPRIAGGTELAISSRSRFSGRAASLSETGRLIHGKLKVEATAGIEPAIGVLQTPALTTWPRRPIKNGAEDEVRTRDLLLGKETRYHCATSAR